MFRTCQHVLHACYRAPSVEQRRHEPNAFHRRSDSEPAKTWIRHFAHQRARAPARCRQSSVVTTDGEGTEGENPGRQGRFRWFSTPCSRLIEGGFPVKIYESIVIMLFLVLSSPALRVAPPVMQLRGGVPFAPQQAVAPVSAAPGGTAGFVGGVVPTPPGAGTLQQKVETLRTQLNLASGQTLAETIASGVQTIGLEAEVKSLNMLQTVDACLQNPNPSPTPTLTQIPKP